jgi:hypothetical protein
MTRPPLQLNASSISSFFVVTLLVLILQYKYTSLRMGPVYEDIVKNEKKTNEAIKTTIEVKTTSSSTVLPAAPPALYRDRYLSIWNSDFVDYKKEKDLDKKFILFWTDFCAGKWWGLDGENITVANCIFTHKKDYFEHSHQYDAIILHGAAWWKPTDVPKTRSPHQLYFMHASE